MQANFFIRHFTICCTSGILKSMMLPFACGFDACTNNFGCFSLIDGSKFIKLKARYFYMQINTIKKWSADFFLIARNFHLAAGAMFLWISSKTTGTWVLTRNKA